MRKHCTNHTIRTKIFVKSKWGYGEDGVCLETESDEDAEECLVPPDTVKK